MFGIVDVGGGLRGVYSSGIYDAFLDAGFQADYCIGVSAGAANLITYLAKQRGRTLTFYRDYPQRKEYMSMECYVKTGSYINLDYLYTDMSNEGGENPLDYRTFEKSEALFRAVATRAKDGEAHYFTNEDLSLNNYAPLKATCCLPVVCRAVEIDGESYFDGGVADPIPYKKAFEEGCDKVLVVLTKPREDYYIPMSHTTLLKMLLPRYSQVAALACTLHERCGQALSELEELEKEGKVIILEPKDCFGMKTLTKDRELITKMYEQGYKDGEGILAKCR